MSSCHPAAKTHCSEKTDWDRSVGTHKALLRHPEIYWVNELHQDLGLSYWSPFKRLNWCHVNKQTVKEMAETFFPFHLFPLLLLLPLLHLWALVTSPRVYSSTATRSARINVPSIHDCLFQGEGKVKVRALSQQSGAHISPQGVKGCKVSW